MVTLNRMDLAECADESLIGVGLRKKKKKRKSLETVNEDNFFSSVAKGEEKQFCN